MDAYSRPVIQNSLLANNSDPRFAIRNAAKETGADFGYLLKTAQRESGMDPAAKASTSSATGLFQFTDGTWLSMVDRYGEKYGLISEDGKLSKAEILAKREDPRLAALMAGELANENSVILSNGIGREPNGQELYIAHFLGPKGAVDLINAVKNEADQSATDLFPAAARANPSIFKDDLGRPRTVSEVYSDLVGKHGSSAGKDVSKATNTVFNYVPASPSSSWKIGAELSAGMVMTLLDLQQKHLENTEKQQNVDEQVSKTLKT